MSVFPPLPGQYKGSSQGQGFSFVYYMYWISFLYPSGLFVSCSNCHFGDWMCMHSIGFQRHNPSVPCLVPASGTSGLMSQGLTMGAAAKSHSSSTCYLEAWVSLMWWNFSNRRRDPVDQFCLLSPPDGWSLRDFSGMVLQDQAVRLSAGRYDAPVLTRPPSSFYFLWPSLLPPWIKFPLSKTHKSLSSGSVFCFKSW